MKKLALIALFSYATSSLLFAPVVSAQKKQTPRDRNIASVVATEKAFAKLAMDSTVQLAFIRNTLPNATLFRPRASPAANWLTTHTLPRELMLTWQPVYADVSRAGDLAYTIGPWASAPRNSQADPHFGQYLSIWQKQKDGRWMLAVNASPPGPAEITTPPFKPAPPPVFMSSGKPVNETNGLLAADNAFGTSIRTLDYGAAMKAIATPDVRLLRAGFDPSISMDSVVSQTSGARVTMWLPIQAVVAASADLGYTRGSYVIAIPRGGHEQGDYIRVWRRDKNGKWRVAIEMLTGGR